MAGNVRLSGENTKIALEILAEVTTILDKHHIPYWLEGGTLLGIIRENRLLPWDNDIDISIKHEYFIPLQNALKESGLRVRTRYLSSNQQPLKKGNPKTLKIRQYRYFFLKSEVCLDVFVKYDHLENTFWQVGEKIKSVPSYFYAELIQWPFNGKNYLIPSRYNEYLTYRYGDWKTPVKDWNTFTDDNALKENK